MRVDRIVGRDAAAWLLAALFVACVAPLLGSLEYNYDEGLYIQQALLIHAGRLPFRDFFYHQTPLYPFTLALPAFLAPRALLAYRGPSLVATALSGVFVHRVAQRFVPRRWALVAQLLFYAVPLQFYGLLATPLAMMQLCITAGIALAFFSWRPRTVVVGVALCCLSVLYKPLSVAACLALAITVVSVPAQRRKIARMGATAVVVGVCAWGFFHVMSGGAFTQVVGLQASRYATQGGYTHMMEFEPFRKISEAAGVDTALGWNLNEHRMTFFGMPLVNGNLWLLVAGLGGLVTVWRPAGRRWRGRRLLLTLWLAVSVAFTVYLWEPIWDHYCIQYVAPLATFAAIFFHALWTHPAATRRRRAAVATTIALTVAVGLVGIASRRHVSPDLLLRPAHPGEAWLTFDPFVNFVSGTEPACGIIDPLNTYGERSLLGMSDVPELARFHVTSDDVIRCLRDQPGTRVAFGTWAAWFVEPPLRAWIERLPPERFVTPPPAH